MSTLSPAPRHAGPGGAGTDPPARPSGPWPQAVGWLLVALGLALITFVTTGGGDLVPNTVVEVVLLVLGAAAVTGLVVRGPIRTAATGRWPVRDAAGLSLLLFAGVAALTAASVAWSVTPDLSWVEAGRTLAYVCAFGAAMATARLWPRGWTAVLGGLALAAVVVAGWAALVRILDLSLDGQPQLGRLLAPFGYFNATGLAAALGLPPLVWCGARRSGSPALRGLAVAGLTLLLVVDVLSLSRSALFAAVLGLAALFACSGSRLRSALVLGCACLPAAAVSGWALTDHGITGNLVSQAARASAGRAFAAVLVAGLLLAALLGWLAVRSADRTALSPADRRRVGAVLLGLLALVPVAVVILLALSSRGFTGEVSHIVSSLTSSHASINNRASRIVAVASSRPAYWRQGISVGVHHLVLGAGAGSFGIAHLRYGTANLSNVDAGHAHSYVVETFADFGLVGLLLNLLLLLAWAGAARRALATGRTADGAEPPVERGTTGSERDGLVALLAVVVTFGASSTLDWTWFFPGVAVPALLAAGWLAGRGRAAVGRGAVTRGTVTRGTVTRGTVGRGTVTRGTVGGPEAATRHRALLERPGAILGLTGLLAATLVLAYLVWQPLRAQQTDDAAGLALAAGRAGPALADARAAEHDDPVSLTARDQLAVTEGALGEVRQGRSELLAAIRVQPQNPESWEDLAEYELQHHEPGAALTALHRAARLDITGATAPIPTLIGQAQSEIHAK